jgi:hypothetical protein
MKTPSALLATAATIALAATVLAAPASAAPAANKFIGGCRAQGDYATCVAGGNVNYPLSIRVHIIARPGQHVSGAWSMTCAKGSGAGSKSGKISGWASVKNNLVHKLRMPYSRPDFCSVAADAQLAHGGHLRIWLTART